MAQSYNDALDAEIRQELLTFTQNLDGLIQQLREATGKTDVLELLQSMSNLVDGQLAEFSEDPEEDDEDDLGHGD